ncbi:hypothetical protein ACI78V_02455 [Geodermatophilus sp. SYSU D00742]
MAPAPSGSDDYATIRAAYDAAPNGGTLVLRSGTYQLSRTLDLDRNIHLQGSWSRDKDANAKYGTVIRPMTSATQESMTALIKVSASYVGVRGLALYGHSTASGIGVLFGAAPGASGGPNTHQSFAEDLYAEGFASGSCFGVDADHVSFTRCTFSGNYDGLVIARGNKNDLSLLDCALDGNARSSVFLEADGGTTNCSMIRTHLGFSRYGILQDPATSLNVGFNQLTMIASPIEYVTEQMLALKSCGGIRILGGYWAWATWAQGPDLGPVAALPAATIGPVTLGPVEISSEFVAVAPNPNSPALVQVTGFTNHPIKVTQPLNGFCQTCFSGNWVQDIPAPAVPASATALTNAFSSPVQVFVNGGIVSAIHLNGIATGITGGTFRVPPGGTISITYTAAPSWVWVADVS